MRFLIILSLFLLGFVFHLNPFPISPEQSEEDMGQTKHQAGCRSRAAGGCNTQLLWCIFSFYSFIFTFSMKLPALALSPCFYFHLLSLSLSVCPSRSNWFTLRYIPHSPPPLCPHIKITVNLPSPYLLVGSRPYLQLQELSWWFERKNGCQLYVLSLAPCTFAHLSLFFLFLFLSFFLSLSLYIYIHVSVSCLLTYPFSVYLSSSLSRISLSLISIISARERSERLLYRFSAFLWRISIS